MTNDQKKQLETQLWNIADSLRGKMNADEFRDYCLGFIFYKYLSERLYLYANEILAEDGIDFLEIDENSEEGQEYLEAIKEESIAQLGYFLKPWELFSSLAKRALGNKADGEEINDSEIEQSSTFILDDLTQVLANIERSTMGKESEDDFDRLFEDLDLTSSKLGRTPKAKNALIAKILVHLDKIDFGLDDTESDVLGDAYEYLIGQFASGAGKKAGEFYTPQQVSEVLAKIVTTGKDRLKSVYDPTCGSGSLLLRVAKEVKEVAHYYGQEMNRTTYNLARTNMILHGVHYRNFDLKQEDTLENPQHEGQRFETVVANPPFSAKWSANKLFESDDRFSQYGKLAPQSKADFAFVQHMIHHLDDNGAMAVVLPHGVLFRGAAEAHIRQYLIKIFSQQIRFKQDDGKPFPDWEKKKLGELGTFKNGFNADKQAFGTGSEFVNLMDIFGKNEIKKTFLERVEVGKQHIDQYKIKKGDVLFVCSSVKREGVGQSCLVNDDFENTIYSGFIIRFREKKTELCHLYKKYCFSSFTFRKKILSLATSSANTNINQDSLASIRLFYPCIEEQEKITNFLTSIDKKIEAVELQIDKLEEFKQGLLQKIFV